MTANSHGGADRDAQRSQRTAVLVSAYHAAISGGGNAGTIAIGWVRTASGGPVEVLVAGSALRGSAKLGAAANGEVSLALPGGALGQVVASGGMAAAMSALPHWTTIAGIADGLLCEGAGSLHLDRASLEECLLAAWDGPFGWLVIADPLAPVEITELAAQVAGRQRLTAGMADRDPEKAVEADRLQRRHIELRQGLSSGLWRLHLLAGAAEPEAAARVAGLFSASADLDGLPYALTPSGYATETLPELLDVQPDVHAPARTDASAAFPFHGSTGLLATLARVPEVEVPGVRLVLRPEFDVTPEQPGGGDGPASGLNPASRVGPVSRPGPVSPGPVSRLGLGVVLDRNGSPAGNLSVSATSLNRHVFVCGATGTGKSQTVRALLEAASGAGLPWLVVEPAKAEYRLMSVRLDGSQTGVVRIRPGEADQIAAGINPLEPAADTAGRRFPLQTHADLVRALFLASFSADEPFPQVLSAAVTRVYEEAGWDLALGEPATPGIQPRYPTLADLQAAAERIVAEIGYGREITDNVRGFIKVRLSSLRLGTTGRFFEGGHPIDFGKLMTQNVVFEIEDVGDDRDKAFLMGTVLIRLTEHLRMQARMGGAGGAPGLRHLSVFEEAHRLLRRPDERTGGATTHAVEMFAGLLAEIRAYGEGLVIAEQIPAKLIPDAVKNTAVKIVHRLPAADDREAVGATMNMTDAQSRYLVTLPPGHAAVFTDGMDYPVLATMPDGTAREAAAPAVTSSPAAVVSPRSGTCGPDCLAGPCTLRDMRAAQRTLDSLPTLVLWAELSVLAHLTGWSMPLPAPRGELAMRLAELTPTPRLLDCAIAHAVDAGVACRASTFSARVSPDALAVHVATAMRRWIAGGARECFFPEPQWLAPAFRWALILDDLKTLDRRDPGAGRHPRSAEWEHASGRAIPGETCARQIGVVQRWYDTDQRDPGGVRMVAFGTVSPAAVEKAVGSRAADEDWEQRLPAALGELHDCRWPLDYLRGSTASGTGR
ncbi:MAG TPA: ATP-binding protein [Streptosporangiaceae bacterium]|nr:ATP-binding protein [Streptosporangiaceae bacterium]